MTDLSPNTTDRGTGEPAAPDIAHPNTPDSSTVETHPDDTDTDTSTTRYILRTILQTILGTGEALGTGTGIGTKLFLQKTVVVFEAFTAVFLLLYPFAAIAAFLTPNSPGFIEITTKTAVLVLTFLVLGVTTDYISGNNRYE